MKKLRLALLSLVLLSACTTPKPLRVEVMPFPPAILMAQPQEMKNLPNEDSDLRVVWPLILENESIANTWRIQLLQLQDWIKKQQEIYK